ncbi:hypothetical protein K7432_008232 [Basidiobolus ranarum]|uniref:Uncharacterized protein n=1 Tax=Basidiobolus ranarum TaxID=34480 RepID=A0ABR2WS65_9FUNG
MLKSRTLQTLMVEESIHTPVVAVNVEESNKNPSRRSYGSCDIDVRSIKYLTMPNELTPQPTNPTTKSNNTEESSSWLELWNQHSTELKSTPVESKEGSDNVSLHTSESVYEQASFILTSPSTLNVTTHTERDKKAPKPKIMIFGDLMEPRREESSVQDTPYEGYISTPMSPTNSSFNSLESTSVYQKSKTLLRKASGLFSDKQMVDVTKSQSTISLSREQAHKKSVLSRTRTMSKFVGNVKHQLHHALSRNKPSTRINH